MPAPLDDTRSVPPSTGPEEPPRTVPGDPAVLIPSTVPSAAADAPADFPTIPGYDITGYLSRGGQGVVYHGTQRGLNRPVAVKMPLGDVRAESHGMIRFLAEAAAVAAVTHPHVVRVYEFGDANGRPYLALEFCDGGTLDDHLKDGALPVPVAADLVRKIARGVAAAHDAGIVHRDLKPTNILFDSAGEPKVADFGLAKQGTADVTRTRAVMGTPAYMAPEQAKGESKFVGPAADVWALGVVLHECLTGKRLFPGTESWDILRRVLEGVRAGPRSARRDVPWDLEQVCLKCLRQEPHERYPTARALADDLDNFLAGRPVTARPAAAPVRAWKWARRNRWAAAAVTVVVGVSLTAAAVSTYFAVQAKAAETEMRQMTLLAMEALPQAADMMVANSVIEAERSQEQQAADETRVVVRAESSKKHPVELKKEIDKFILWADGRPDRDTFAGRYFALVAARCRLIATFASQFPRDQWATAVTDYQRVFDHFGPKTDSLDRGNAAFLALTAWLWAADPKPEELLLLAAENAERALAENPKCWSAHRTLAVLASEQYAAYIPLLRAAAIRHPGHAVARLPVDPPARDAAVDEHYLAAIRNYPDQNPTSMMIRWADNTVRIGVRESNGGMTADAVRPKFEAAILRGNAAALARAEPSAVRRLLGSARENLAFRTAPADDEAFRAGIEDYTRAIRVGMPDTRDVVRLDLGRCCYRAAAFGRPGAFAAADAISPLTTAAESKTATIRTEARYWLALAHAAAGDRRAADATFQTLIEEPAAAQSPYFRPAVHEWCRLRRTSASGLGTPREVADRITAKYGPDRLTALDRTLIDGYDALASADNAGAVRAFEAAVRLIRASADRRPGPFDTFQRAGLELLALWDHGLPSSYTAVERAVVVREWRQAVADYPWVLPTADRPREAAPSPRPAK